MYPKEDNPHGKLSCHTRDLHNCTFNSFLITFSHVPYHFMNEKHAYFIQTFEYTEHK
jgi:hypothetical protein